MARCNKNGAANSNSRQAGPTNRVCGQDLSDKRQVTAEEGQRKADELEFDGFIEVSNATGQNVDELFTRACRKALAKKKKHGG